MDHPSILPAGSEERQVQTESELAPLVAELAEQVWSGQLRRLWLRGGLGAGKTTLTRLLLQALGVTGRIKSPSFSVVESYELPELVVHHADFYRLQNPSAWRSAGLRELFAPDALVVLEWPEMAEGLPPPDLEIELRIQDPSRGDSPRLLLLHRPTGGKA